MVVYVENRGHRSVSDQQILIELLEEMLGSNFVVFRMPQNDDFVGMSEHAEMFAGAAIIIGPHGGGLANMMFAPSYTTVIEFELGPVRSRSFEYVARAFEMDYISVPEISSRLQGRYKMEEDVAHSLLKLVWDTLTAKQFDDLIVSDIEFS